MHVTSSAVDGPITRALQPEDISIGDLLLSRAAPPGATVQGERGVGQYPERLVLVTARWGVDQVQVLDCGVLRGASYHWLKPL